MPQRDPVSMALSLTEIELSERVALYCDVPVVMGDFGRRSCGRSLRRCCLFGVWPRRVCSADDGDDLRPTSGRRKFGGGRVTSCSGLRCCLAESR